MDAPRRGNKHTARGRAKRHPGNPCVGIPAPCKGKSIKTYGYRNRNYLITNVFALSGRIYAIGYKSGVPLRSAPGYVLVAPAGRVLPGHVHPE